jgi:hypothetical protein
MTVTGIHFNRLVRDNGWQFAVGYMQLKNHTSLIANWPENLQKFILKESYVHTDRRNYTLFTKIFNPN